MSNIEMDTLRVEHVTSTLRAQVTGLTSAFTKLTDAERLSADPLLLQSVRTPLTEFLDEAARLADIIDEHHFLMANADTIHPTDYQQRLVALASQFGALAAGLGDGRGAAGTAAEMEAFGFARRADAETSAETVSAWMEEAGVDGFTVADFAALVGDKSVPQHVRDAVAALVADPVLMANLDRAGWHLGSNGHITPETVALLAATQEVSRGFGDTSTFDAFDGAKNGELDDRISMDDVLRVAADESADPEARALATMVLADPSIFDMLDTGTLSSGDPAYSILTLNGDGRISFGDVVATAVNTQAFEGRAVEARDFTMGLPSTNDFRDGTGNILQIKWFSDSGVRALAQEALTATPSLSEQVGVVERLPESPGGIRNLAITVYYRRIGADIDLILNPDGDGGVLPLDAEGSTGTNWFMQGAFASSAVRPVLVDNDGYSLVTAGWAARQSMADGNQLLFGSLAPAAAAFIEAFPPGSRPTQAEIEGFFRGGERANGRPLFEDGDRQLRDGFALMLDAAGDPNPVTRQQTTFRASLMIGVHEQALVDPFVDRALDQGWDDGFRVLGDVFDQDESIANGQIDPDLGGYAFDADKPLPVRHGHPDHVIGQDLTTTLNPTLVTTVTIGGVTYDLSGSGNGDVDLAGLAGWDDVPDVWDLDSKVIDPAVWHREHGSSAAPTGPRGRFETVPGSTTGVPLPGNDDLPGAAASDWKDYPDRMWTIVNSFQQTHTLPGMAGTPGNGFSDADISFIPEAD